MAISLTASDAVPELLSIRGAYPGAIFTDQDGIKNRGDGPRYSDDETSTLLPEWRG